MTHVVGLAIGDNKDESQGRHGLDFARTDPFRQITELTRLGPNLNWNET